MCKHAIAPLFALRDEKHTYPSFSPNVEKTKSVSKLTKSSKKFVTIKEHLPFSISIHDIPYYTDLKNQSKWIVENLIHHISKWEESSEQYYGEIVENKKTFKTTIKIDSKENISCTCNCGPRSEIFCIHAHALLLNHARKNNLSRDVFFTIRNHDRLIASQLIEYGYTLDDPWQEDFEILIENEKIQLKPKQAGLSKTSQYASWNSEASLFVKPEIILTPSKSKVEDEDLECVVLWAKLPSTHSLANLFLLEGRRKKNGEFGTALKVYHEFNKPNRPFTREESSLFLSISELEPSKYLKLFGLRKNYSHEPSDLFPCQDTFLADLRKSIVQFRGALHFLLLKDDYQSNISSKHIQAIRLREEEPGLTFDLHKSQMHYVLTPIVHVGEQSYPLKEVSKIAHGVILVQENLYLLGVQQARVLSFFDDKDNYIVLHKDIQAFTQAFLLPLAEQYDLDLIDLDEDPFEFEQREYEQICKLVYLKETDNHLLFIPVFSYVINSEKNVYKETNLDGGLNIIISDEQSDRYFMVKRSSDEESATKEWFQQLHPSFQNVTRPYFSINYRDALRDQWFLNTFTRIKEAGYEVLGLKELKKLKYSPHKPSMNMTAGSGIDWFDLTIEVTFGDEKVRLSDIRKAIVKKQDYVELGNGTKGILPQEWLEKYSHIFKVGKVEEDQLTFSAFQIGIIDELFDEIDNGKVLAELLEKQAKLKSFKSIKEVDIPEKVNASLRKYQVEGFNWLNFLDEYGWGGCLADDMGLGKTLQVLTLLTKISAKHPKATHLIVVPRSLIFNWVEEVQKFCSHLSILIYSGPDRKKSIKDFKQHDLIITTYGLVRRDILYLKSYSFHYIVLDESQAIKNPTTQITKAVKLLKAQNRLVMTGTPIENSTYDLYSQIDFINPGMLGSMDTFKEQFANPIDKDKDEAASTQLKKLVYPFILSRKKNQVAKELPEKTEIVLYGEMKAGQRRIYNYYKQKYRNLLENTIATEGFQKAGIYILQGLNKLRQICNSPVLVSMGEDEMEAGFTDQSVKLEILLERLHEIVQEGHKVLVFSFFTGMLALIEEKLAKENIGSLKLTGKSRDRQSLVHEFKSNIDKKVFLISLKAGGFGLNLTEASYVFLVDPWWNPAVEQQAIDRTHRIGQDKQIFAYKLICKDTIEEKILSLQEKKKALAGEIIHTEAGFLKKLTPEDVQNLFT